MYVKKLFHIHGALCMWNNSSRLFGFFFGRSSHQLSSRYLSSAPALTYVCEKNISHTKLISELFHIHVCDMWHLIQSDFAPLQTQHTRIWQSVRQKKSTKLVNWQSKYSKWLFWVPLQLTFSFSKVLLVRVSEWQSLVGKVALVHPQESNKLNMIKA